MSYSSTDPSGAIRLCTGPEATDELMKWVRRYKLSDDNPCGFSNSENIHINRYLLNGDPKYCQDMLAVADEDARACRVMVAAGVFLQSSCSSAIIGGWAHIWLPAHKLAYGTCYKTCDLLLRTAPCCWLACCLFAEYLLKFNAQVCCRAYTLKVKYQLLVPANR